MLLLKIQVKVIHFFSSPLLPPQSRLKTLLMISFCPRLKPKLLKHGLAGDRKSDSGSVLCLPALMSLTSSCSTPCSHCSCLTHNLGHAVPVSGMLSSQILLCLAPWLSGSQVITSLVLSLKSLFSFYPHSPTTHFIPFYSIL